MSATRPQPPGASFWRPCAAGLDDSLSSPDNCAWLAEKLGKCIIGMRADAFAPQSLECFLESGLGPGLKFAIMYVSVTDFIPEQNRRGRTAATTYPFGCSLQR
jgi:hypothetical protein